jgi:hypothetical protein
MIKGYNGFKTQPMFTGRQKLPAGVYVAKVYDVELQTYNAGKPDESQQLIISFDIFEGEHKGFFKKDWDTADVENRKWRGTYRLWIPKGDGSEADKTTRRIFEQAMWAFEESNAQFHWAWDEKQLKGLFIGVKFRNKEYDEFNGAPAGWTTECCGLADTPSVRAGKVKTPKDKPLEKKPASAPVADNTGFTDVDDSELPF